MKRTVLVVLLAVVALSLMATSAFAATVGPETVNIKGTINAKMLLTLDKTDIVFNGGLGVDPGAAVADENLLVTVETNTDYTVARSYNAADFTTYGIGLVSSANAFDNTTVFAKTGGTAQDFTETFSLDVTWDAPAGAFSTPVAYTLTSVP